MDVIKYMYKIVDSIDLDEITELDISNIDLDGYCIYGYEMDYMLTMIEKMDFNRSDGIQIVKTFTEEVLMERLDGYSWKEMSARVDLYFKKYFGL